jgi:hypothetical protein
LIADDTLYMLDIKKKLQGSEKIGVGNFDLKPHTSQSIGGVLQYRNLQLSYDKFNRRDHSSLGFNPAAVSGRNPSNYFGESQSIINLKWKKNWKKFGLEVQVQSNSYITDDGSSTSYNYPYIFKRLMYNSVEDYKGDKVANYDAYEYLFFEGNRKVSFGSNNRSAALNYNFKLFKFLYVNGGLSVASDDVYNYQEFVQQGTSGFSIQFGERSTYFEELAQWFNMVYQNKRIYINTAYRTNIFYGSSIAQPFNLNHQYRLASSYRIVNKTYMYANTSKSINVVPAYYYLQNKELTKTIVDIQSQPSIDRKLSSQTNYNHEFGLRSLENNLNFNIFKWHQKWIIEGQASVFMSRYNNLFEYKSDRFLNLNLHFSEDIANEQDLDSYMDARGVQYAVTVKNFFHKPENFITLSGSYSRYNRKYDGKTTNYVAEMPNFMQQIRVSYMPLKNFTVVADFLIHGKSHFANINETLTKVINKGASVNNFDLSGNMFPKASNLDLLLQYRFSSNFQVYLKINNFLEQEMMGLSNISNPNDNLFYVPQSHAMSWIGLNYTLD